MSYFIIIEKDGQIKDSPRCLKVCPVPKDLFVVSSWIIKEMREMSGRRKDFHTCIDIFVIDFEK